MLALGLLPWVVVGALLGRLPGWVLVLVLVSVWMVGTMCTCVGRGSLLWVL